MKITIQIIKRGTAYLKMQEGYIPSDLSELFNSTIKALHSLRANHYINKIGEAIDFYEDKAIDYGLKNLLPKDVNANYQSMKQEYEEFVQMLERLNKLIATAACTIFQSGKSHVKLEKILNQIIEIIDKLRVFTKRKRVNEMAQSITKGIEALGEIRVPAKDIIDHYATLYNHGIPPEWGYEFHFHKIIFNPTSYIRRSFLDYTQRTAIKQYVISNYKTTKKDYDYRKI